MTYPPQFPNGPQQPGGYPPPGQPQGWYPPQGNPYGQPPQGPFPGGTPGYQPGGYGMMPPPRRNKTGFIVGLIIGVVLLIGGGTTTFIIVLTSGDSNSDAAQVKEVAQKAVTGINQRDVALVKEATCNPENVNEEKVQNAPPGYQGKIVGEPAINGNTATIEIEASMGGKTDRETLKLRKESRWCVGSS